MKMSNYFALPVKADDYYRVVCDDGIIIAEDTVSNEEISHAINMHDDLVNALEMIVDGYSAHDLVGMTGFNEEECQTKIIDVLEKAKS